MYGGEKRPLEDLDLDARIILKWILEKENLTTWAGQRQVTGSFECGSAPGP